jgi:hypothetical protein
VLLVPQDPLVLKAIRAILVLLDRLALLAQQEPKDPKDRRVSKVKLDQKEMLDRREKSVLLALSMTTEGLALTNT